MNVLDLTAGSLAQLPKSEQDVLFVRSGGTTDLETLEQLKQRVREYIHIRNLEGWPVKLGTVNRAFHRPATALDTTIKDVVEALLSDGTLVRLPSNATILATASYINTIDAAYKLLEMNKQYIEHQRQVFIESAK